MDNTENTKTNKDSEEKVNTNKSNINPIFREKSIERVSSPEQLDAYLKVTSPKVWFLLSGIIVLLAGIICWGIVGKIETSEPTTCAIEKGKLYCYTVEETAKKIDLGYIIKLDGSDKEYKINHIEALGEVTSDYAVEAHLFNVEMDDYVYELVADCELPESAQIKKGKIIIETISPIKFVFN